MKPKPINILIVDDNLADGQLLAYHLRNVPLSLNTRICNDSTQITNIIIKHDPMIVFLDNYMGKMRGIDLLAELSPAYPHIAFVLLTGAGDEQMAAQAFRAGAADYLTKDNLDVRVLERCVQHVLAYQYNQQRLRAVLLAAVDAIITVDDQGCIEDINPAGAAMFGYEIMDLVGKPISQIIPSMNYKLYYLEARYYLQAKKSDIIGKPLELEANRKNGTVFPIELTLSPVVVGFKHLITIIIRNITARKAAEEAERIQWKQLAECDPLTGLANRALFLKCLQQAITAAEHNQYQIAVLFVDLDYFKTINDSFGHEVGDKVLQAIAKRLQSCVRSKDLVARLGGDEFVVMINQVHSQQHLLNVVERILVDVSNPCAILDQHLKITASIGVAVYPLCGETPEDLLRCSDIAMYNAKDRGRDNFYFYESTIAKSFSS